MNKNLLKWEETLFRDPDVFELSYVPEQFNYRDDQTEALAFSIRPALRGGRILDTVCRGPPATGKTTSVRKIYELIGETTDKIVPVHINCKIDNTEYAVFARIYTRLTNQRAPPSGTSLKQILDQISHYMQANKIRPLVCLDDANYLIYEKQFVSVIYPLVRMHETFPDINIGLIVIISDPQVDVLDSLDVRTRSTFHPELIEYPPYTTAEIAGILNARVNAGLYPHVLPPSLLDRIVDICMQYEDVRFGLDIIKRSVLNAERDARKTVTEEDLDRVLKSMMNVRVLEALRSLAPDELSVIRAIVAMLAGRDAVSTKEIEASVADGGPKRSRLSEILLRLDQAGLIEQKYVNDGKGRRRFISLKGPRGDFEGCLRSLDNQ